MPFSMSNDLSWFFDDIPTHPNLIQEGFEALLPNPARVIQVFASYHNRNPSVFEDHVKGGHPCLQIRSKPLFPPHMKI